ncbi:MAG TPA: DciA family protein [Solirubrobacterales bacterium]|nr:DciA family protein [Solirubrobacterales bacterium]
MRAPRSIGDAIRELRARAAPETLLAAAQEAWPIAAGEAIAAEAEPVSERARIVTVACRTATWAQELDLLQEPLLERLNATEAVSERGGVARLRFTADATRHED